MIDSFLIDSFNQQNYNLKVKLLFSATAKARKPVNKKNHNAVERKYKNKLSAQKGRINKRDIEKQKIKEDEQKEQKNV